MVEAIPPRADRRPLGAHLAAVALALAALALYATFRMEHVGGADSYGYYSLSLLFEQGRMSLPVGLDPLGLPIGLQLMAAPQRDDLLFSAGRAFERVLGTARQRLEHSGKRGSPSAARSGRPG